MKLKRVQLIIQDEFGREPELKKATPELVAEMFAEMYSDEQAQFFNHVAKVASRWDSLFEFQLQAITDEDGLTLGGRRVMQGIGDYSHWGLVPTYPPEEDNDELS